FAISLTALGSADGGEANVSLGMRNLDRFSASASCRSLSATINVGPIGTLIPILYARTADSPKWVRVLGVSSHLRQSRRTAAASCAFWFHPTPGRRSPAPKVFPASM